MSGNPGESTLVMRTPLGKAAKRALPAAGLVAAGVITLLTSKLGSLYWFAGVLGTPLFALAGASNLYRALTRKPVLVLSPAGLQYTRVFVPWEEVATIRIGRFVRNPVVVVGVKHPEMLFKLDAPWKRRLGRFSRQIVRGDLMIFTNQTAMDPPELVQLLDSRMPATDLRET